MVVACNTATGAALPALQAALPIPVIGVIRPGASAALATNPRTIGVIGTDSTIKNGAYERTLHELQPAVQVVSQPAQPLVSIVEHGQTGTPAAQQAVDKVLQCFATQPVETLILGCTHFPFLSREIQRRLGPSVHLIDPAYETVQTVKQVLTDKHLLAAGGQQRTALYTTGRIADLQAGADKWLAGDYGQCSSVKLDGE
jgi:glutamate racemase